jgi:hypothetical protein
MAHGALQASNPGLERRLLGPSQVMTPLGCKACIALSLLPLACASIPRPSGELHDARAAVLEAQAVAQPEAAYELALARAKLAGAGEALARGDYVGARILAEQAEVDARYAAVVAKTARLQREDPR